ncbi:DUF1249 domain-containing protein [Candidatus Poribacteria bacterium]|nr:DUF1249 domain-containing protein [Candidatus Poribacteria bacterium]
MIYETILKKLYRIIPHLDEIEVGNAVTLKADGFMDLHVDILNRGTYKDMACTRIALSHYYRHPSGDMIPDPDMEVAIYPKLRMAEALTYQDSVGLKEVYPDEHHVRPRLKKELNSFLNQWLSNLLQQGHRLEGEHGNL